MAEQSFAEQLEGAHQQLLAHTGRRALNTTVLVASDLLAVGGALLIAWGVRYGIVDTYVEPGDVVWVWALLPLFILGAAARGLYPGWGLSAVEVLRREVQVLTAFFGVIAVILFLIQHGAAVSRLIVVGAFCLSLILVPLLRTRAKRLLINAGLWGAPTVIYGAGDVGRRVVQALREEVGMGYVPCALFDDDIEKWGTQVEGVPVIGGLNLATNAAPVAVLAIPSLNRNRTTELLEGTLACYPEVIVVPDIQGPSLWVQSSDLGGLLGLRISSNLISLPAQLGKRSADLACVLATAPLWAAMCLVLAFLVWVEDRYNPLFVQERVGQHGRSFRALKFRTMVPAAEAVLQRHLANNPAAAAEWEQHFKLTHDPRVTRVGRFLRRFSLDELPQLINVLRGEMSLVGPRPLPRYHHEELPKRVQELRERVRPGLTGLWQVSGRSDIGTAGMERWDCYYVRNWSLWLDVVVLRRTFRAVMSASGAY